MRPPQENNASKLEAFSARIWPLAAKAGVEGKQVGDFPAMPCITRQRQGKEISGLLVCERRYFFGR